MKIKDLILDRLEISASQFCRVTGISRQTFENIIKDDNGFARKDNKGYQPSLLTIKKVCKYFNVDFRDYL